MIALSSDSTPRAIKFKELNWKIDEGRTRQKDFSMVLEHSIEIAT